MHIVRAKAAEQEMSNFTFDYDVFSDLYKDVNGFRPRGHEFYAPETTDERRQEIWDFYCEQLDREMTAEREREGRATTDFEDRVAGLLAVGAGDRETAIRWLMDAEDVDGDVGYFEYKLGLPAGYLMKEAA
jgi:hypothetical protein